MNRNKRLEIIKSSIAYIEDEGNNRASNYEAWETRNLITSKIY